MGERAIAINACVRDILRGHGWFDPDKFGLRLSDSVSQNISAGFQIDQAVARAIAEVETEFFRANRGAKAKLQDELVAALENRGVKREGLMGVLRDFKRYAERQLVRDLVRFKSEDIGRGHLQTHLNSLGRTYREVHIGAGRSDILLFLPDTKEIIEAKVWDGQQYHDDGLQELETYMRDEGLEHGYYVVFDYYKVDAHTPGEARDPEIGIDTLFIHIPLTPPSKIGRARRAKS